MNAGTLTGDELVELMVAEGVEANSREWCERWLELLEERGDIAWTGLWEWTNDGPVKLWRKL